VIVLRDSTLREGLDVPGLRFSLAEQLRLARNLAALGIREIEIGAPGRARQAQELHRRIKAMGLPLRTSGLVFGFGDYAAELRHAREFDRADILMPLGPRGPRTKRDKLHALTKALDEARVLGLRGPGAGLPHASRHEPGYLLEFARAARQHGATRLILYDTDGSSRPDRISALVKALKGVLPIHFHGHDDLSLAVANSLAAAQAGASFIDCTLNGLGDRAGNCPLEPLAVNLHLRAIPHGLKLRRLKAVSDLVAGWTGLRSGLFPVTGELVWQHVTRTHRGQPRLFEAFPPELVGARRKVPKRPGDLRARSAAASFEKAVRTRRSIRHFTRQRPPRSLLRRLIQDAWHAPSSMDGRPWHFVVIEDRGQLRRLADIKSLRQPAEKSGYPCGFLAEAPCAIVICVDERLSWGREVENAALAAASIMLCAHASGLGTTYLSAGRPGAPALEREVRKALGLPARIKPCVILPLGYPLETPGPKAAGSWRSRVHADAW